MSEFRLIAFVALVWVMCGPAALAQATAPSVALTLNASRFEAGQTMTVGLTVQNQAENPAADLYVGFLLPDGQTVVFLGPAGQSDQALASLITLMEKYGVDGGSLWRWTSNNDSEDTDPTLALPLKRRGVNFIYNPVKNVIEQMY